MIMCILFIKYTLQYNADNVIYQNISLGVAISVNQFVFIYFNVNVQNAGLDIKVLVLPAPGQVVLSLYLPNYKIYMPNINVRSHI